MNKKFKIAYYFFVTVFALVFSYQVYRLVDLIVEKPTTAANSVASDAGND